MLNSRGIIEPTKSKAMTVLNTAVLFSVDRNLLKADPDSAQILIDGMLTSAKTPIMTMSWLKKLFELLYTTDNTIATLQAFGLSHCNKAA